ncbi:MAG TPA: sulfotransferase domain-containing protein [Gaiellaceae bacterium]|nr:sulfotransferase domain-containing protein [Gaiellaceae bacterium]
MLAALEAERAEYVVIGGLAAALAGAAHVTFDLDITPNRSVENLERVAAALRRMNARLVDVPDEVAATFKLDGVTLANGSVWTFITDHGRIDVTLDPSGTQGYRDLRRGARPARFDDVTIFVASLADVIRSKQAADRPRDRAVLPHLRRVLNQQPVARGLTVLPTDVFLVSYPRSGSTWLRFLLANALRPERRVTFADVGDVVPDIYDETDRALRRRPEPRVLKSHEPYDERYRRVLYAVRDPADVAVSYYHYLIKMRTIPPRYDVARFVDSFVRGRLDDFGTWGEHVTGWLDAREGDGGFVLLRYEDMLRAPREALDAALDLLGVEVDDATRAQAVARSEAGELRRLERETATTLPTFRGSGLEDPFIRKARAGTAVEELTPELRAQIADAWPEAAARVGYGDSR